MITIVEVAKYYSYFYSRIYGNLNYTLNFTKTSFPVAQKFVAVVAKEYAHGDEEFLWKYCVFQFMYYSGMEMKNSFTDNKPIFVHVFGPKSYERYKKRDTQYDYLLTHSDFIKKFQLVKSDIRFNQHYITVNKGFDSEERMKEQFMLNDEDHFINCIDMTTLFKPDSIYCQICKYHQPCKQLLRDNYPELYKLRKI